MPAESLGWGQMRPRVEAFCARQRALLSGSKHQGEVVSAQDLRLHTLGCSVSTNITPAFIKLISQNHSSSLYAPPTPQCETQGRVGAKTNTPGKDVGSFVRLF